jgi:hypothetical protein
MESINPQVMRQVLGGTQTQLNAISAAYEAVRLNLEEIRQNQNVQMQALATIYAALEALAMSSKTELPKPLIDMSIEQDTEKK